jgi:transglutaminase-like putative cysteine protease
MSIPRAADVLQLKRGDCNEHAVLYAALCRAAGIPAKTCAGIVYLDGSFYYHAWVELYLQQWISVDPTTNQFPADVTHIKFVEGELDKQLLLLNIVGKLAIDVLEYS